MKKVFLFLFVFLHSFSVYSCLNGETKELTNGHLIYHDPLTAFAPQGHQFRGVNDKLVQELDSLYRKTKNQAYLSDKGYVLIVLGKYTEAIQLYLSIEKTHPNRYSTASNIGTAYELLGEDEKALKWIKKSLRLNAKSHNGSEWIHVRILEAKIHGVNSLEETYLINDFGKDPIPTTNLSLDSLKVLRLQLAYQLNERMSFVKPQDKIVSLLLFELGNICYLINPKRHPGDIEKGDEALVNFNNAIKYGFTDKIIEQRIFVAQGKNPLSKPIDKIKSNPNKWIYWVAGCAIVLILVFLAIDARKAQ